MKKSHKEAKLRLLGLRGFKQLSLDGYYCNTTLDRQHWHCLACGNLCLGGRYNEVVEHYMRFHNLGLEEAERAALRPLPNPDKPGERLTAAASCAKGNCDL